MPVEPEWEYHFRWAQVIERGIANSVDELDARDTSLEEHLRAFGPDRDCNVTFDFPFRWQQIVESTYDTQIYMLTARDDALMDAIASTEACELELPFKWAQLWPGLVNAEGWAVACAEENDRAIEDRFQGCNCGGGG